MSRLVTPFIQPNSANSKVLPGGKLYTYEAGTTTPKATYTTSTFATAHTNPVIADSSGNFPEIYLDDDSGSAPYKLVFKTSNDVQLAVYDSIVGLGSADITVDFSSFGGILTLANGSASTPSLTFTSDTATGLYRYSGNSLGLTVGGNVALIINSDGTLSVTSGSPTYENLITDPNDIPNKKYVDDAVNSDVVGSPAGSLFSHTNLQDIGSNTHAQIDSHITDSTIHFTKGSINLEDLANTSAGSPTATDGQILTWVGSPGQWKPQDIPAVGGITDHGDLTSIGTYTHAQIDSHIDDSTIHFTIGSVSIGDVSDVNLTGSPLPSNTDVLQYNGSEWVHVPVNTVGVTDHTDLTNIGTNTHAQIDTHIADSTIHFTITDVVGSPIGSVISHTNLQDIGSNTHAQIDSHIADSTIHFTAGSVNLEDLANTSAGSPTASTGDVLTWVGSPGEWQPQSSTSTDHGGLTGLGDDDHTQYSLVDGSRNFTGDVTQLHSGTSTLNVESSDGDAYIDITHDSVAVGGSSLRFKQDATTLAILQTTTTGSAIFSWNSINDNLMFESDGSLSVSPTGVNYEDLVTSDDDIPNKKYVDDAITASVGISNVVEDTSPQLGGNLDLNGFTLTGVTANRAIISNGSGVIATSATTDTEIGYLSGVTSSVQTQINNKADLTGSPQVVVTSQISEASVTQHRTAVIKQYAGTRDISGTTGTITAADAGYLITTSSGSAVTLSIASDALAQLEWVDVMQRGAGQVTLASTGSPDATFEATSLLGSPSATAPIVREQYGGITITSLGSGAYWIVGDLETAG